MLTRTSFKRKSDEISKSNEWAEEIGCIQKKQKENRKFESQTKDTYIDIKLKPFQKKKEKTIPDWQLVGVFDKSPKEFIYSQLDSLIGWKSYFKSKDVYRFKCFQEKLGCKCELRITLLQDDPEDFVKFEIKVEISGEHGNHKDEDLKKIIEKRKRWGRILTLVGSSLSLD